MKILKAVAYSGPNVLAPYPLVHLRVAVEGVKDWPSGDLGLACADRLLNLLPGLLEHPDRSERGGGFAEELRVSQPPPLAYVAARVASELQRRHDADIRAAGILPREQTPLVDIHFRYDDPDIGLLAGRAAISLVLFVLPPEARPANTLPSGIDPERVIAVFQDRLKALRLDQTAVALISEAERRGIPWFALDRGKRVVQLGQGHHLRRICESITSNTPHIGSMLQHDKAATNRVLSSVYLPVPRQILVQDVEAALRAAQQIGYPLVVKPYSSIKGRGITLLPEGREALRRAFERAQEQSPYVLIEDYIAGSDHRALVVGGKLVAIANRIPAAVTGDGVKCIAELVEEVNKDPQRGIGFTRLLTRIELDEQTDLVLERQGCHRRSIPPDGAVVSLRGTANISTGGTAIDVTDQVHPVNRLMLERTARVMGLDVAGIDFITPDITRPYREVKGAICEVNASPGLRAHLAATNPQRDVVGAILDTLFPRRHNGRIPIAAITGTNGKTTTSRMLAHILRVSGKAIGVRVVGLATTDGVLIGEDRIVKGDLAGVPGAGILLRDPSVEAAVLETARGGLAQSGMAVDWCDVGALLNVAPDHLGYDGIETLDEMAALKGRVVEAARKLAVLNADDPYCLALAAKKPPEQVCLFAARALSDGLQQHLDKGGMALSLEEKSTGLTIVLHHAGSSSDVIPVKQIPATLGGAARHNTQNAMAAVGLALGLGLQGNDIADALVSFEGDHNSNPGRFNVFDGHPLKVVVDYAHNPDGLAVVCDTLQSMKVAGRRICVLAAFGHWHGEHIQQVADMVADQFDIFICSRNVKRSDALTPRRGFPAQEIPKRLAAALLGHRLDPAKVTIVDSDKDATDHGLALSKEDDLLMIFTGQPDWAWDRVVTYRPAQPPDPDGTQRSG